MNILSRDEVIQIIRDIVKNVGPCDAELFESGIVRGVSVTLRRGFATEVTLNVELKQRHSSPSSIRLYRGETKELYYKYDVEMDFSCSATKRDMALTIALIRSMDELVTLSSLISSRIGSTQIAELCEVVP